MHHHAPIPAAQPHLSLNAFSVPSLSREERNGRSETPSYSGALASKVRSGLGELPQPRSERVTSVQWESAVSYPAFCTVTASGPIRRPAARRRSASLSAPLRGLGSSQNKFANDSKRRRANFFRAPPRKQTSALGAGPTR